MYLVMSTISSLRNRQHISVLPAPLSGPQLNGPRHIAVARVVLSHRVDAGEGTAGQATRRPATVCALVVVVVEEAVLVGGGCVVAAWHRTSASARGSRRVHRGTYHAQERLMRCRGQSSHHHTHRRVRRSNAW